VIKKREQEAIDLYTSGMKVPKVLIKVDRKKTWLYNILIKNDIPKQQGIPYYFDENALDKDTSNKFYILGLFAADGYLIESNKNNKYIGISLHKKDKTLLEDICKVFKYTKPLSKNKNQLVITLRSKKLFDLFIEWGIVPRKSLTLEIIKNIPLEFINDFLRGVFDGDGCITGTATTSDITFCTTGSEKFANQLKELYSQLGHDVHLYKRKKYPYNPMWDIKRFGVSGIKILSSLYTQGSLYLPRKYEKLLSFTRLTLDEIMMEVAYLFSKRSTCGRLKVGCILTDISKNNIISFGYNGGVSGMENYCESSFPGDCGCIHAEQGALIKDKGPLLYCTHFPCANCAKLIINAGVTHVMYSEKYRDDHSFFTRAHVKIKKIQRDKYIWKL